MAIIRARCEWGGFPSSTKCPGRKKHGSLGSPLCGDSAGLAVCGRRGRPPILRRMHAPGASSPIQRLSGFSIASLALAGNQESRVDLPAAGRRTCSSTAWRAASMWKSRPATPLAGWSELRTTRRRRSGVQRLTLGGDGARIQSSYAGASIPASRVRCRVLVVASGDSRDPSSCASARAGAGRCRHRCTRARMRSPRRRGAHRR